MDGYIKGLEVGNTEKAAHCINCYLWCSLIGGRTLNEVEDDSNLYLPQIETLRASEQTYLILRMGLQVVLNLIGTSESITDLSGTAFNECLKKFNDKSTHQVRPLM